MIYRDDVISIAASQVGYMEKLSNYNLDDFTANAGAGNFTKYARDLWEANPHFYQGPKNGYDWCTVFVDWCIYEASGRDSGYAQSAKFYTGPYGAGCEFAAGYYKSAGAWHKNNPLPGDQIFFGSGSSFRHTGLVEKVADGKVYTIEGNSNNMVRRRSYNAYDGSILGYGRPRYDGDSRPGMPFVDVKRTAWYYEATKWAYENGITAGTDETHFSPDRPFTRAEAVQMLYQMNQKR